MPKKETPKTETFIVGILHRHGDEFSKSVGKIDVATDDKEELEKIRKRIEKWIEKKMEENKCKLYGDKCVVDVREAYSGLKSVSLLCEAEEIKEE